MLDSPILSYLCALYLHFFHNIDNTCSAILVVNTIEGEVPQFTELDYCFITYYTFLAIILSRTFEEEVHIVLS